MKILITGGAGYIGSHVVKLLGQLGHEILTYDDLSTGKRQSVLYGKFVEGSLSDTTHIKKILADGFDAVFHFAASISVDESISNPLKYYDNNTTNTLNLLKACYESNIDKIIFSSSAAVYGNVQKQPVTEQSKLNPASPYGWSKLMSEKMIEHLSNSTNIKYAILRYFNVAGADIDGDIGQADYNTGHLIKTACECAVGKRKNITIFGTDYPTRDGTCVRDFVHVHDLAMAHINALNYLDSNKQSITVNVGYGDGFSVRDVIAAVNKVCTSNLEVIEGDRRSGDMPILIADNKKIRSKLGWVPEYNDLHKIIESSYNWELKKIS